MIKRENMSDEVNVYTLEEYIKKYPEMASLDPMNKIDFSLSDINPDERAVLKIYFSEICTDFTLYMQLFSEKESIEQLNQFNSFVFNRLERAYLEKICLKMETLMDPAVTGGKKNLSLKRFIEQTGSAMLETKFKSLEGFYISSGIKDWRNKVLAHADLKAISGINAIHLQFERNDVDNFIAEIQEFIDCINDPRSSTDHRVALPRNKDGYAFIEKLREHNKS